MLGKISNDVAGKRDAVHTPCILVKSVNSLIPGDLVRFVDNENVVIARSNNYDGVVDPFIDVKDLKIGSLFWVLLKPNMTSNLTHYFDVNIPALSSNPPQGTTVGFELDLEKIRKEAYQRGYDEGLDNSDDEDGCRGCY